MCIDSPDPTYQSLVVNLLPDEFVLAQGVAGFSGDRVYRPLLHLLFYGTVQHEKRLAGALLGEQHAGSGQRKQSDDGGGQKGETQENIISSVNANVSGWINKKGAAQQNVDNCETERGRARQMTEELIEG